MTLLLKPLVIVFSAIGIIAGVAGFFVSDIIGIETNPVGNVLYILVGIFGINASGSYAKARWFLILASLLFGILAILGFAQGTIFRYYATSQPENVLHAIVALVLLTVAFSSKKKV
ncbi:MAG: DUF4383 domain-containing protein [Candidatus Peribacteraceae bacterium]|nr:DUF4383 domain-containing protein [Candidatus Peribacteraceae bacterium]